MVTDISATFQSVTLVSFLELSARLKASNFISNLDIGHSITRLESFFPHAPLTLTVMFSPLCGYGMWIFCSKTDEQIYKQSVHSYMYTVLFARKVHA